MFSIEYFATEINKWIAEIQYPSAPKGLYEPIAYMLSGGGKRVRPTLLCAVCESLGRPFDFVKPQALGIEMFHNFTLLHDDVMDNATMRHGKPTVHCKWSIPTAILSGDTMLTMATQFMADCSDDIRHEIIELFNATAIEIYEGQQYDMNFESSDDVTVDEYIEMIRLKTAVLLGCACKMGAKIAGASSMIQNQFYRYGIKLGLAFQFRDDYLDTFGDPNIFGKQIGGDIVNNKKTWLSIQARNQKPLEMLAGDKIEDTDLKIAEVKRIYTELDLDNRCMQLVETYTREAIAQIADIGLSNNDFEFFESLALTAIRRNN